VLLQLIERWRDEPVKAGRTIMRIAMGVRGRHTELQIDFGQRRGGLGPPNTFAELRRDQARLHLIMDQAKEIEKRRLQRIQQVA
jgi:hypothetical protein